MTATPARGYVLNLVECDDDSTTENVIERAQRAGYPAGSIVPELQRLQAKKLIRQVGNTWRPYDR